jgi:putative transposase
LCASRRGLYGQIWNLATETQSTAGDFSAERPDQTWLSDITYIWTEEGWLYLAVVLDLYSRQIIGWAMSPSLSSLLTLDARHMALTFRRPAPGWLPYSDQGQQYARSAYQKSFLIHSQVNCVV